MITLRPYQQKSREWVNRELNQNRNPLLVMPTGSGKSPTSAKIAEDRILLKNKILVLVPQYELFNQMMDDYSDMNPGYIDDSGINGRNRNIYICMTKSLNNILYYIPENFCMSITELFIDEAHFSGAKTWEDIYSHFSHCNRFGFTATPLRYDNKPLSKYFDSIFEPIKISECIENKYLSKPIIVVPDQYKDFVPDEIKDIDQNKDVLQKNKIIGDMVKVYKDVFDGEPVIVPCANTEHAKEVKRMYENAGWNVDHIYSGLTKNERSEIINNVKKGKTNILVTVGVGVFGLNITGLKGIIWLRFTESLVIYLQFCGRAARIMENKKHYIMIDPVGNSVIHGRPDIDRQWTLTSDYIPGQDVDRPDIENHICPVCGVSNNAGNNECWICGYSFITGMIDGVEVEKKKRKLPKMVDGELVFIDEIEGVENGNDLHNSDDCNFINLHNCNSGEINISGGGNNNESETENSETMAEPTRAQKIEILNRNLTGIGMKNKFKENLKWLD